MSTRTWASEDPVKTLFLPDYSGANAYQRELSRALASLGVEVVADPTRPRRVLPVMEALWRHGRPDILHLHWTEPYIAGRGRISRLKAGRTLLELSTARRLGARIVWTAHDLFRHDHTADPVERAFMRSLYARADAVIVHCRSAADALAGELGLAGDGDDRVHVIPHGHYAGAYPDEITREGARDRLDIPEDARVFAFVGWVRPYKGVRELMEAFRLLEAPQARLVVAGRALDDAYAGRLRALAADDDRIQLRLEFLPDDDLQVYLRAADAVATPFQEIFTSGSVLLAMSFGRAVIAPRRGCVTETVDEDGGVLYDADDPQGLEGALRVALAADLDAMGRHNLGQLGRLDWARVAEATRDVYEAVL